MDGRQDVWDERPGYRDEAKRNRDVHDGVEGRDRVKRTHVLIIN